MNYFVTLTIFSILFISTFKNGQTNAIKDVLTVTINQGTLVGKQSLDYWNGTFYSFEGIPYAKPPIGSLRFKAPEPAEPWAGIYDATQVRPICPQPKGNGNELLEQSEDCLFLNVHTKMSTELKPVMVWIHGGGMQEGSIFENNYGPELLMSEDIVLVKLTYRLTVFGFLSLDDPKYEIHGNAGLKDQVMALKWVQQNIHHFGGDPNQVTIFGESAGGASVHLLYLSPLAKGLFHRAISQSGAAGNPWLTSPNNYHELAQSLNCDSDNLDTIVNCINSTTADDILAGFLKIQESEEFNEKLRNGEVIKYNSLTIESPKTSNSFLAENPEDIARNGKFQRVPIIMGFNTHEGTMFIDLNCVKPNVTDYRTLIPRDINVDMSSKEANDLGTKIKEFYYGDQTPSNDLVDPFIDYLTDTMFFYHIYKFAKLQSNAAKDVPLYFYHFDYRTKLNSQNSKYMKYVNHFDDVQYLFYVKGRTPENLSTDSDEYIGIHRMVKLWTTFAKSQDADPNPINDPLLNVKWERVEPNKFNYLKISQNLEMKQDPFQDRVKFWEQIYEIYNGSY